MDNKFSPYINRLDTYQEIVNFSGGNIIPRLSIRASKIAYFNDKKRENIGTLHL